MVPGLNHDERTLARMAGMVRDVHATIPWHLNAFVPRYRLHAASPASSGLLMLAAGSAYVAGSRYVYVGNASRAAELAHTRCPGCQSVVVRRHDYSTTENALVRGACPRCATPIEGLWERRAAPS